MVLLGMLRVYMLFKKTLNLVRTILEYISYYPTGIFTFCGGLHLGKTDVINNTFK